MDGQSRLDFLLKKQVIADPSTGQALSLEGDCLRVKGEPQRSFPLVKSFVPVLLEDQLQMRKYASSSEQMSQSYAEGGNAKSQTQKQQAAPKKLSFKARLKLILRPLVWLKGKLRDFTIRNDYRPEHTRHFLDEYLNDPDSVVLSVGGGPIRAHPRMINLNVDAFTNVDIVGDAHKLPIRSQSVDAIHCEAVLEHLSDPGLAVEEMYRVLKKGGKIFSAIPFLQAYHGYPHHYQNFTITGHHLLYEKRGFKVLEEGALVGPINVFICLVGQFILEHFWRPLRKPCLYMWWIVTIPLRPWDKKIVKKEGAHSLASITYVFAQKN